MKRKKRSEVLLHDLHDGKCPTEGANFANNGSSAIPKKRKAKHTKKLAETNYLSAHVDNVTSRNGVDPKDHMESSKKKSQYFKNNRFDAPKATGEAYPTVSSHSEECHQCRNHVANKKIKSGSYDSKTKTGSLETPSDAYLNIVSGGQEREQKQTFCSNVHHEDNNIYVNHQRPFANQSSWQEYRLNRRHGKQIDTHHEDTCNHNNYHKSITVRSAEHNHEHHDPHMDQVLTRGQNLKDGNARGHSIKDADTQHDISSRGTNCSTPKSTRKNLNVSKFVAEGNNQSTKHKANICSNGAFVPDQLGQMETVTPNKSIFQTSRKLLVLDLNGILVDILRIQKGVQIHAERQHINVSQKTAFKRPFCDEFLDFCFRVFDVGIWSSRMKYNVEILVDYLMGDRKKNLLFCWDNSKCTHTGFNTVGNSGKPLVLKELRKLWDKEEPDLPWEKGTYSASNTLLIDDSPCKAICNPPCTGIFPCPYRFRDEKDNSLGTGGDIRLFLEGLAKADNVQHHVENNPFGQGSITDRDSSWKFYLKVIQNVEKKNMLDGSKGLKKRRKKKKKKKEQQQQEL